MNKAYRNRIMKYASLERQLFLFQDLLNVYKKIQENDILKCLLFTKRQLHIYDTIPKPIIFQHKVNSLFVPKKTIVELYNEKTVIAIKKDIEQENINPKICNVRKKVSENNAFVPSIFCCIWNANWFVTPLTFFWITLSKPKDPPKILRLVVY